MSTLTKEDKAAFVHNHRESILKKRSNVPENHLQRICPPDIKTLLSFLKLDFPFEYINRWKNETQCFFPNCPNKMYVEVYKINGTNYHIQWYACEALHLPKPKDKARLRVITNHVHEAIEQNINSVPPFRTKNTTKQLDKLKALIGERPKVPGVFQKIVGFFKFKHSPLPKTDSKFGAGVLAAAFARIDKRKIERKIEDLKTQDLQALQELKDIPNAIFGPRHLNAAHLFDDLQLTLSEILLPPINELTERYRRIRDGDKSEYGYKYYTKPKTIFLNEQTRRELYYVHPPLNLTPDHSKKLQMRMIPILKTTEKDDGTGCRLFLTYMRFVGNINSYEFTEFQGAATEMYQSKRAFIDKIHDYDATLPFPVPIHFEIFYGNSRAAGSTDPRSYSIFNLIAISYLPGATQLMSTSELVDTLPFKNVLQCLLLQSDELDQDQNMQIERQKIIHDNTLMTDDYHKFFLFPPSIPFHVELYLCNDLVQSFFVSLFREYKILYSMGYIAKLSPTTVYVTQVQESVELCEIKDDINSARLVLDKLVRDNLFDNINVDHMNQMFTRLERGRTFRLYNIAFTEVIPRTDNEKTFPSDYFFKFLHNDNLQYTNDVAEDAFANAFESAYETYHNTL